VVAGWNKFADIGITTGCREVVIIKIRIMQNQINIDGGEENVEQRRIPAFYFSTLGILTQFFT